jgi:hypothetical protein
METHRAVSRAHPAGRLGVSGEANGVVRSSPQGHRHGPRGRYAVSMSSRAVGHTRMLQARRAAVPVAVHVPVRLPRRKSQNSGQARVL